ncbi:MAG: hypothetical protein NZ581_01475 [Candidatus Caldarchaeum sp.]|nr:hypothetical protein [Candidatus Caldarchaeum sp.]MDW8434859.1 hypothetical protein [Candidatus Caldarchaeum sp.]
MNPLKLLAKPSEVNNIEPSRDIRKALLVFTAAALSQILVSLIVLRFKTVYEIALGPYSRIELRLFQLDYIVMSSLTTVFVALVMFVGVGRIFGRFLGKNHASMRSFLTAFLFLFTVFAVINVVYAVSVTASSPEKYYVFGAQFTDVIFQNATLSWVDENGVKQTVESPVLYAKKANVTRITVGDKAVETGAYTAEEIDKIIQTSSLKASLQQPSAPPYNLPPQLNVENFEFEDLVAKNVLLTSVAAVKEQPGAFLPTVSVLKNFIWRLVMSVYAGLFVMHLHGTSRKSALLVMVFTYLAVTNFVPALS